MNGAGLEGSNHLMANLGTIPWLQDPDDGVWSSWGVVYRDVVILDEANRFVAAYNLTSNDLSDPAKFAALHQMLVDAASD